tara:strand:+ start:85 stop:417 length:333 start_codon:yes stop_codon:yes gene_type:complete
MGLDALNPPGDHRATPRTVSDDDLTVGLNIRKCRRAAGMTLDDLSKHLGLSYQQVHKYENGTNRIAAGTLWRVSKILKTPVEKFYPEPEPEDRDEKIARLSRELSELVRS